MVQGQGSGLGFQDIVICIGRWVVRSGKGKTGEGGWYERKVDFPHDGSPRRRMVMVGGSSIDDGNWDISIIGTYMILIYMERSIASWRAGDGWCRLDMARKI